MNCAWTRRGNSLPAAGWPRAAAAARCGASLVVLAHNHPSGLALPSAADQGATDRVQRALDTVGIQLLDHIVVADGDYVSMAQNGTLRRAPL